MRGVAFAPPANLNPANTKHLGNLLVLQTFGSQQHNTCALLKSHTRELRANQFHQFLSLVRV
jgi:hypothetical protein